MKILIFMPHLPLIFDWIINDNVKLLKLIDIINHSKFEVTLKFHPRYSQYKSFKKFISNNIAISEGYNSIELIKESDLIIAMESSSVVFEAVHYKKPFIYWIDFITIFDNETAYTRFINKISCLTFDELKSLFKSQFKNFDPSKYLPKISENEIFSCTGKKSGVLTKKIISNILFELNGGS